MRKWLWWTIGIIIFLFLLLVFFGEDKKEETPVPEEVPVNTVGSEEDYWKHSRARDVPDIAEGWSEPKLLEVSVGPWWGDSLFVTGDGKSIYFMHYPGDLITDRTLTGADERNVYVYNADIYVSHAPFTSLEKDTRFYFDEDPWSAWGPMFTPEGDVFYATNRDGMHDYKYDGDVFLNTERLPFNNDTMHDNPHYCEAYDELWMSVGEDENIVVLYDAKKNGFDGVAEYAPEPIAIHTAAQTQPYLTPDCETIYFSSKRDDPQGWRLAIYKSERLGKKEWAPVEKVIWNSDISVGEPTLTDDGKKLFYIQVFQDQVHNFTTEFFYLERE